MIDHAANRFTLRMLGLGPGKLTDTQVLATLYLLGRLGDQFSTIQELERPIRPSGFSDEELLQHAVDALAILRRESQTDEDVKPSAVGALASRIHVMTAVLDHEGRRTPVHPPNRRTTKALLLTGAAAEMLEVLEDHADCRPAIEAFLVKRGWWA